VFIATKVKEITGASASVGLLLATAVVSVNSSIALWADDTKCYPPVMNIDDGRLLQEDLDRITFRCQD